MKSKEEEQKEKKQRRRKEKQQELEDVELQDVPKGMAAVFETLEVLLKGTLQNYQVLRALQGSVWLTFLVPLSLDCCKEAIKAGRDYFEMAQKSAKGLPPPHTVIFMAFLEVLAGEAESDPQGLEAAYRVELRRWIAHFNKHKPALLAQLVPYFRGVEAYHDEGEEEFYKVSLVLDPPLSTYPTMTEGQMLDVSRLNIPLVRELERLGARRKSGPPPRGALERVLQKLLLKIQKTKSQWTGPQHQ